MGGALGPAPKGLKSTPPPCGGTQFNASPAGGPSSPRGDPLPSPQDFLPNDKISIVLHREVLYNFYIGALSTRFDGTGLRAVSFPWERRDSTT